MADAKNQTNTIAVINRRPHTLDKRAISGMISGRLTVLSSCHQVLTLGTESR
jgi:hypothetical protein